jgi:hypothetical protein
MAMLFTAACGSDDASTDSGTSGTTGQNGGGNSAFAAYISCLNENGVTVTMPSGGPGGGNGGTRPSGAPGGGNGGARPSGQPRPSGSAGAGQRGGGGMPGGGGFSKPEGVDDATWTKAQEACASVRPSMGAGGGNRGGGNQGGGGANAAYNNCLKENGVTDTANLDTTDATVKKAVETCSVLKPTATS